VIGQPSRQATVVVFCLASCSLLATNRAAAEKTLSKTDDWEVYTDGRAGAFFSYAHGDARPLPLVVNGTPLHDVVGGGLDAGAGADQTLDGMRVRSGFIDNIIGLGVRVRDGDTTYGSYIQIWSFVESEAQEKNRVNFVDVRQGYAKVEGPWGSVLAGKMRCLFSRGATDIDTMYAHRYGLGYPGNIDSNGPTLGHIGFGVIGSGFAAGLIYGTPVLGGLQLNVGIFDPIHLQGAWQRTKYPRGEAEATFQQTFGETAKVVLFANGAYQKVYQLGNDTSNTAGGVGYGGRIEVGPVHLGVAGHYGKGLGLNYALELSGASVDPTTDLRQSDGYYVQSQFVLGAVDLSAGWGITRVFLNPADRAPDPQTGQIPHSVIKHQMGVSAGIVYHVKPWFHIDADYFRAEFEWFLGEKQVVNFANAGMVFTW
jgi:hypothetical protein